MKKQNVLKQQRRQKKAIKYILAWFAKFKPKIKKAFHRNRDRVKARGPSKWALARYEKLKQAYPAYMKRVWAQRIEIGIAYDELMARNIARRKKAMPFLNYIPFVEYKVAA